MGNKEIPTMWAGCTKFATTCPNRNYNFLSGERAGNKVNAMNSVCPRCESENIFYQREQAGNIGVGTNRVVIQTANKSHGCLYWVCIGWWLKPMYWICIGWWCGHYCSVKRKEAGLILMPVSLLTELLRFVKIAKIAGRCRHNEYCEIKDTT